MKILQPKIYEVTIIFEDPDAQKLIKKHGFIKVDRHWEIKDYNGSNKNKWSVQEALQVISLGIIHDAIRGVRKIKVNPLH